MLIKLNIVEIIKEELLKRCNESKDSDGFDLSYAGVILGPSIKYRDGHIVYDPSCSFNEKAKQKRKLKDGSKKSFCEIFLNHELGVLLTRGVNGLYIYACDEELRERLKKCV